MPDVGHKDQAVWHQERCGSRMTGALTQIKVTIQPGSKILVNCPVSD